MRAQRPELTITRIVHQRTLLVRTQVKETNVRRLTLEVTARLTRSDAPVRTIAHPLRLLPRPDIKRPEPATFGAVPSAQEEDAYLDYRRVLTPEGGVLIAYKDLDLRIRHTLWRLCAWLASMAGAWAVVTHAPAHNRWITLSTLLVTGILNWLIVRKPVEVLRSIEIRPDCMILESKDVFWLQKMEGGWPVLKEDDEGNHILCGTYGTRFVEYLTVRRFDDEDRTPEVFAAHLQEAIAQLWGTSLTLGTVQKGSGQ